MQDRYWESQIHFNHKDPLRAALDIIRQKENNDRLNQMLYMDFDAQTTESMSAEDWEALMEYEKQRDMDRT